MNFTRINKNTAHSELIHNNNNNQQISSLPVNKPRHIVNFRPPVIPTIIANKDIMTWGRATWFLFHTLAHKVKDQYFLQIKLELCNNILRICSSLPCLMCQTHATEYMNKINFDNIKTKSDLKKMLFNFHNVVNERKNYQKLAYEKIDEQYEKANLHGIVNNFFINMSISRNRELVSHNLFSDLLINKFKIWLSDNIKYFNK